MTIKEIIAEIEKDSAAQAALQNDNNQAILDYIANGFTCIESSIENILASYGCASITDVVILADRQIGITGDEAFVQAWLETLIDTLSITPSGINAALITFPKDNADGTTLGSTVTNHNLTGSAVSIGAAASGYTLENLDGRAPLDQALSAANTELVANGRAGANKAIILLTTTASNYFNGYGVVATDPIVMANNIRPNGYEIFVVSVGATVNPAELEGIAGDASRVYSVATYDELIYTVDSLKAGICDATQIIECLPDQPELDELEGYQVCEQSDCCNELF